MTSGGPSDVSWKSEKLPRPVSGVRLVERADASVRAVSWVWIFLSVLYLVLLMVLSAFYAFAPPWDSDFRLLPPPGTGALWVVIAVAFVMNFARIGGAWALIAGQRGRPAVKAGWCVMVVTLLAPVVDLLVNVAERVRGVPGRFTPLPIGLLALASVTVLCLPSTLKWVWTVGALHVPKLKYEGNFAKQQAQELGLDERAFDEPRQTGSPPIIPYRPGGRSTERRDP